MTSEEIKAIRRRLGLTRDAFAVEAGVHWITITRWENGHAKPRGLSVRSLEQLAARAAREEVRA